MKMFIVTPTRSSESRPDLEGSFPTLFPYREMAESERDERNEKMETEGFHFEAYEVEIQITRKLNRKFSV